MPPGKGRMSEANLRPAAGGGGVTPACNTARETKHHKILKHREIHPSELIILSGSCRVVRAYFLRTEIWVPRMSKSTMSSFSIFSSRIRISP